VLHSSWYNGYVLLSMAPVVLSRVSWSLARVGGALRLPRAAWRLT
jgi:hypothetical protein